MQVFIIILMFITTVFAVNTIKENAHSLKEEETKKKYMMLSNAGCYAIAFITAVYDVVSLFILVRVV